MFPRALLRALTIAALALAAACAPREGPEPPPPRRAPPEPPPAERVLRERIDQARARCPGTIQRSLGLDFREDARLDAVRFELRDSSEAARVGLPPTSPGGFHLAEGPAGAELVITVFVDRADGSDEHVERFLCHELVHAMMAISLGPRTPELPRWLHEGLAIYGSGQLGDKLAALVATRGTDPEGFPDGLERHAPGLEDLVEDALAVSYIAHYRGADAVRELTARLVDGEPPDDAVEAVTGFDASTFQERVDDFIRVRLRSLRRRR